MKIRKYNAAAALGSLTATVALLAGMSSAQAQAPGAGSFPGSILLPGTNTSFKVGGYVKGDYTYDFSAQQNIIGGWGGTAPLDAIPGHAADSAHHIHGTSQMTASESRFNFESRTPTGYGELKTFIEGDFTNPNGLTNTGSFKGETNSSGFRLRYAYGTLGPWLAGQYNSVFRDSASEPETLDFGGPFHPGPTRQPQLRYTYDFGGGLLLAAAAENPQTFFVNATTGAGLAAGSSTFGTGQGDKIPDFTFSANWNQPWGHLNGHAVFRDLYDNNGAGVHVSEFGWAVGLSGDFKTFGKDDFAAMASYGEGAGRYVDGNRQWADLYVNNATNGDDKTKGYAGTISYQHWWTDELRSTIAGSYSKEEKSNFLALAARPGEFNRVWGSWINLIWSPVPQVDFGVEWIRANFKIRDGQSGDFSRIQTSAKFKF